jgi:hypothetical protein
MALIMIHQDQQPEGIARTQVAREIILQGGPTIQTAVSLKGLHVSVRIIAGMKGGLLRTTIACPHNLENCK